MKTPPDAIPSIDRLKDEARRLRDARRAEGEIITHSESLERLAHRYKFRDWNTLHAAADKPLPACPVSPGTRVRGRYLGQSFAGEVLQVETCSPPDRFFVTLHFDAPVDVVTFDSFSNMRQRVRCTIDSDGRSDAQTSDGCPHMQLEVIR